ncbi:MAG: helix-turn-helix transcriptional regulator [Nannocystaceae bacterium]
MGAMTLDDPSLASLSKREREVLRALLRGVWVEAIAGHLSISPHTVRNHIKSIYRKMGVHSQGALLALFVESPEDPEGPP